MTSCLLPTPILLSSPIFLHRLQVYSNRSPCFNFYSLSLCLSYFPLILLIDRKKPPPALTCGIVGGVFVIAMLMLRYFSFSI